MQDETKSPFIAGHFSERTWENMWRETSARVERLEAALREIAERSYDPASSETARAALGDAP